MNDALLTDPLVFIGLCLVLIGLCLWACGIGALVAVLILDDIE